MEFSATKYNFIPNKCEAKGKGLLNTFIVDNQKANFYYATTYFLPKIFKIFAYFDCKFLRLNRILTEAFDAK
ncbi:unnamed protein product [Blepharisma stoltei]|uniref:Uncharacterized protein n=1 Tax=Blepharisma stoltei TaxID=1481888 RepID=A0AAU9JTU2_9CILI|nr:unnamed protein product [Blepharisma stoltei]